jgi:hypothetical protein
MMPRKRRAGGAKPFYHSKIFWAQACTAALALLAVPEFIAVIPVEWMPFFALVGAFVTIVFRTWFTDVPTDVAVRAGTAKAPPFDPPPFAYPDLTPEDRERLVELVGYVGPQEARFALERAARLKQRGRAGSRDYEDTGRRD